MKYLVLPYYQQRSIARTCWSKLIKVRMYKIRHTHTHEEYDTWCDEWHTITWCVTHCYSELLNVSFVCCSWIQNPDRNYDHDESMSPITADLFTPPPSSFTHLTRCVAVNIMTQAQHPPSFSMITRSRSQEGPIQYPSHRQEEWLVQWQGIHYIW